MTRVLCTSDVTGIAFFAAAIDAGLLGDGRRVLVVANEACTPEVVPGPLEATGSDALLARFDDVLDWNGLIAPLHPSGWQPSPAEQPVLTRLLAARLAPADRIDEVIVESITDGLGGTVSRLLPDRPITLASHTLAAYRPRSLDPAAEVEGRVRRVLQLELVPGLRPLVRPTGVPIDVLPLDDLRRELVDARAAETAADAVLLDERYAERGVLSADDEGELRLDAVRALVAAGHRRIMLAPHPAAEPADHQVLVDATAAAGATLRVGPAGVSHESLATDTTALVVGTDSAALLLAGKAATFGSRTLLDGIRRYAHPDRLPLIIAHAQLPTLEPDGTVRQPEKIDIAGLVDAVAFCTAPKIVPELRDRAAEWVTEHGVQPYLRRGVLESHGVAVPPAGSRAGRSAVLTRARGWLTGRGANPGS